MAAASRKARFFCSALLRLLLLYMPRVIHATDMLRQGETLKDVDGALLISPGKTFALGFFSPGNRTSRRYFGIWYRGIPDLTVVWVANRDAPVLDRSGTFTLRSDGTLVVSDSRMTVLWSSGTSNNSTLLVPSTSVVNASARLLDTGNLVVNDVGGSSAGNSVVLWQTFDHPADTFLPGMHSGLDLRTGENTLWTSWASPDDPAPGRFYAGVDPRPLAQLVLWERVNTTAGVHTSEGGLVRRWRTGQWNGQSFTGVSHMKPQNLFGTKFSNPVDEKRMYFTYTVYNTNYVRIVVRPDGIYTIYIRNNEIGGSREWDTVFEQPLTACEVYNACGSNAVCTEKDEGRIKRCDCWRGFRPRSKQDWDAGDYSIGGCVRNTPLSCQLTNGTSDMSSGRQPQPMSPGDAFWRVGGVKLPDASDWVGGAVDAQGCRKVCGGNCSCTAYAYVSGIGCMVWGNDLADVRTFPSGGNDVYVKVPASELPPDSTGKKSKHLLVGLVLMGCVFTVAIIVVFFILGMKLVLLRKTNGEEPGFFDLEIEKKSEQGSMPDLPLVSLKAIEAATDKFSECNVLGRGGFGTVYKGRINGGQEVAVKRLSRDSGQGVEEFKNEAILIAKLQHKNLVRLRGCCTQGEEKILVYEYMPNKSLDVFLFDPDNRASLSWEIRFNIIQGIARGLLYLHHDSRLRVIHRDLKASNILLDEDMQPKISDFGIARIFECNQNHANTKRVVGTYGYMSPEYAMDGLFSIKSDVYSFGVLVLEILSGKRNQIFLDSAGSSDSLLRWAWQLWNEDQALEFIDPLIRTTCCEKEALRCMHIGLSCVQDRTADRPTVPSVILMLGSESTTYAAVKQPTFSAERNMRTIDSFLVENTISDIITGR